MHVISIVLDAFRTKPTATDEHDLGFATVTIKFVINQFTTLLILDVFFIDDFWPDVLVRPLPSHVIIVSPQPPFQRQAAPFQVQFPFVFADDIHPAAMGGFQYKRVGQCFKIYLFCTFIHPVQFIQDMAEFFLGHILSDVIFVRQPGHDRFPIVQFVPLNLFIESPGFNQIGEMSVNRPILPFDKPPIGHEILHAIPFKR